MPRLGSHSYLHPDEFVVEEWSEFFPLIKKARLALGNSDSVWFRGQANADHTLVPSLYRVPDGAKHERSSQKFRQLSGRLLPQAISEWQTLFDMQHCGVPTRLLDWTPVLGVAVFLPFHSGQMRIKTARCS